MVKRKSFTNNIKNTTISQKSSKKQIINNDSYDSEQDYDDIDKFQRSKIMLDEESSVDDNSLSDEPVLDIDEDSIDESSEYEKEELNTWGKNLHNYYSADEDAYQEEETEAMKLQKKKFSLLKEQDFVDESFNSLLKDENLVSTVTQSSITQEQSKFVQDNEEFFNNLVNDYKEKLIHIQTVIEPALQKSTSLKTDQCFTFLKMKYHLWLTYCSNICFYMLLKATGKPIQDHPVIDRLVELRTYIEKSKTLEAKLRPQLDRILQSSQSSTDPLSFKPRPNELEQDSHDSEQDDVYHPPHIAPMFYEQDKKHSKSEEQDIKQRRTLKELREQTSEFPEEYNDQDIVINSSSIKKIEKEEALRNIYEEENFVRLSMTTNEKKRVAASKRKLWNELEDLNEFGLDEYKENQIESEPSEPSIKSESEESESEIEDSSEEESYQKVTKKKKGFVNVKHNKSGYNPYQDRKSGERRSVGSGIIKNRGLMPQRSKEQANPRVHQRKRFERAMKRIKGAKPIATTQRTRKPYAGERTGIRADITKSTHFKH